MTQHCCTECEHYKACSLWYEGDLSQTNASWCPCYSKAISDDIQIETNIFDKEEIIENCTVQILTNTITGEVSVGWWRN